MKLATTLLAFCVAGLRALGTVVLCSAPEGARLLSQQLVWGAIGVGACVAAAILDYRKLKSLSWPLLILTVLLLGCVFLPVIGVRAGGASRWINLHWMRFQPSELAKLALIIGIANCGEQFQKKIRTFKHGLLVPGA